MKKILFLIFVLCVTTFLNAQTDNAPAAQLAHKIADKMKDSLNLTNQQRAKIFAINMELHKQKKEARDKSQDRTVVGKELQRIESGRDEMYKPILTEEQYVLYQKKKRFIVTSN